MATVFLNGCYEVLIPSPYTNDSRTQLYFLQTIFFILFRCQITQQKLLVATPYFILKTNSFGDVDRSMSSRVRGNTREPYPQENTRPNRAHT